MRFAFADPPYLGCGSLYATHHAEARAWDDPETHRALIARLVSDYPDGWLMCLSSPSLRTILPMCPDDCRVGLWVKPFAAFKANVTTAYAWELVIFRGGRKRPSDGGDGSRLGIERHHVAEGFARRKARSVLRVGVGSAIRRREKT